ncbi:uncharacterized protein LOC130715340 isoform X1 [Lotus japonicus]|uniref:uncharacterized protein LOC130715340 isoform X1 n=1 Tax=Lotus japonicus TaxID=34305 RepID=UPI00258F3AE0|nr:uncharacterized protein LOC130715340 isoform X1 [Lotus japonicus]
MDHLFPRRAIWIRRVLIRMLKLIIKRSQLLKRMYLLLRMDLLLQKSMSNPQIRVMKLMEKLKQCYMLQRSIISKSKASEVTKQFGKQTDSHSRFKSLTVQCHIIR